MLSQKEALRQKFAQADFTDDVMFGLIMSQPEICKRFLQRYYLPMISTTLRWRPKSISKLAMSPGQGAWIYYAPMKMGHNLMSSYRW